MPLKLIMLSWKKSGRILTMNKAVNILIIIALLTACKNKPPQAARIALAKVGDIVLYYDEVPKLTNIDNSPQDSVAILQSYINKWAKKELLFLKAEQNLTPEYKSEIEKQLEETRSNLVIYQYQRQMMMEKMDTTISDGEMENYFTTNEKNFSLNSNIVKALFIKVPVETPGIDKIRVWAKSNDQKDLQQLETYCYQFAEKFDDFNEEWVTMDKLSVELPHDIANKDDFLSRNKWYETSDSSSVYMITLRDFKPRSSIAPFEYVKNDIKNIILNNRRFQFLQSLENGIYNEAIKANTFKIF
jgi:hypothetical protein